MADMSNHCSALLPQLQQTGSANDGGEGHQSVVERRGQCRMLEQENLDRLISIVREYDNIQVEENKINLLGNTRDMFDFIAISVSLLQVNPTLKMEELYIFYEGLLFTTEHTFGKPKSHTTNRKLNLKHLREIAEAFSREYVEEQQDVRANELAEAFARGARRNPTAEDRLDDFRDFATSWIQAHPGVKLSSQKSGIIQEYDSRHEVQIFQKRLCKAETYFKSGKITIDEIRNMASGQFDHPKKKRKVAVKENTNLIDFIAFAVPLVCEDPSIERSNLVQMYDAQRKGTCCSADTLFKHSKITMAELLRLSREKAFEAASALLATANALVAENAAKAVEAQGLAEAGASKAAESETIAAEAEAAAAESEVAEEAAAAAVEVDEEEEAAEKAAKEFAANANAADADTSLQVAAESEDPPYPHASLPSAPRPPPHHPPPQPHPPTSPQPLKSQTLLLPPQAPPHSPSSTRPWCANRAEEGAADLEDNSKDAADAASDEEDASSYSPDHDVNKSPDEEAAIEEAAVEAKDSAAQAVPVGAAAIEATAGAVEALNVNQAAAEVGADGGEGQSTRADADAGEADTAAHEAPDGAAGPDLALGKSVNVNPAAGLKNAATARAQKMIRLVNTVCDKANGNGVGCGISGSIIASGAAELFTRCPVDGMNFFDMGCGCGMMLLIAIAFRAFRANGTDMPENMRNLNRVFDAACSKLGWDRKAINIGFTNILEFSDLKLAQYVYTFWDGLLDEVRDHILWLVARCVTVSVFVCSSARGEDQKRVLNKLNRESNNLEWSRLHTIETKCVGGNMSTTLYVYTRTVSVYAVSKEMSDNIFLSCNSDLARAVMMYDRRRESRQRSQTNEVISHQLWVNGKFLCDRGIRVLECVSENEIRVSHNGRTWSMSIANVVEEAEKYAVEVEAAGEGVERAAEKGSEVERDDAATVAMAAKAAVAEAAPVAVNPDASDSGTEEAATPTAQGIFLTADKNASGYSMQDQDDEAIEEAVAKSSDEHSQTSDRGETITIDEAVSQSQTSQVISRSGKRPRSN